VPPLWHDDGQVLTEQVAIVQYLADREPEANLALAPGTGEPYRLLEPLNVVATDLHLGMSQLFNSSLPEPVHNATNLCRLVVEDLPDDAGEAVWTRWARGRPGDFPREAHETVRAMRAAVGDGELGHRDSETGVSIARPLKLVEALLHPWLVGKQVIEVGPFLHED
jgi:glutathione S-transferase